MYDSVSSSIGDPSWLAGQSEWTLTQLVVQMALFFFVSAFYSGSGWDPMEIVFCGACCPSCFCNSSSVWRDQMSLSDSVATTTENTSRLGYKHVCVNYLHVASPDYQYQEVIQHTHTHIHTPTHLQYCSIFSWSTPISLSTRIQVKNKVPNITDSKTSVTSMS